MYEKQVTRGAAWLDHVFPGWESRINLETLELKDTEHCICGQVFREDEENKYVDPWAIARNLLEDSKAWLRATLNVKAKYLFASLGFDTFGTNNSNRSYEELQQTWVNLLKERAETGTFSGI